VIYQTRFILYDLSFISFATNRLMAMLFVIGVHNRFFFFSLSLLAFFFIYINDSQRNNNFRFLSYFYLMFHQSYRFRMVEIFHNFLRFTISSMIFNDELTALVQKRRMNPFDDVHIVQSVI